MQRLAIRFAGVFGLFLLHSPAGAQEAQWIRVASPHLEMYTTARAEIASEAVAELEGLRLYFQSVIPAPATAPGRLRIVAFSSGWEYQPFRLNSYSPAYFVGGSGQGTVVLGRLAKQNFPALRHEFIHALARAAGLRLPLWLSEGLADQLAGVDGGRARYRMNLLKRSGCMTPAELASVSGPYQDVSAALRFYASSWALTNLLFTESPYRERIWTALRDGGPVLETVLAASGRNASELEADLERHAARLHPAEGTTSTRVKIDAEPVGAIAIGLVLARLEADGGNWTAAEARLDELPELARRQPEWWALRGDLALRGPSLEMARQAYEKAMDLGSSDIPLLTRLAGLERGRDEAAPVLARLAELSGATEPDSLEPSTLFVGNH